MWQYSSFSLIRQLSHWFSSASFPNYNSRGHRISFLRMRLLSLFVDILLLCSQQYPWGSAFWWDLYVYGRFVLFWFFFVFLFFFSRSNHRVSHILSLDGACWVCFYCQHSPVQDINVRIFWVCAMECMCALTRPQFKHSFERVWVEWSQNPL